jgi:hypothetical protein
MKMGETLKIS